MLLLLILMLNPKLTSTTNSFDVQWTFRIWYLTEAQRRSLPAVKSFDCLIILRLLNSVGEQEIVAGFLDIRPSMNHEHLGAFIIKDRLV